MRSAGAIRLRWPVLISGFGNSVESACRYPRRHGLAHQPAHSPQNFYFFFRFGSLNTCTGSLDPGSVRHVARTACLAPRP